MVAAISVGELAIERGPQQHVFPVSRHQPLGALRTERTAKPVPADRPDHGSNAYRHDGHGGHRAVGNRQAEEHQQDIGWKQRDELLGHRQATNTTQMEKHCNRARRVHGASIKRGVGGG